MAFGNTDTRFLINVLSIHDISGLRLGSPGRDLYEISNHWVEGWEIQLRHTYRLELRLFLYLPAEGVKTFCRITGLDPNKKLAIRCVSRTPAAVSTLHRPSAPAASCARPQASSPADRFACRALWMPTPGAQLDGGHHQPTNPIAAPGLGHLGDGPWLRHVEPFH
jgi:hypothetical protein